MSVRRLPIKLAILVAAMVVIPVGPASAAVTLSMGSTSAGSFTVGDTGVATTVHVTNNSTGAQAAGTVTLTEISLWPSCGAQVLTSCPTPDPGVIALSATGAGMAGSACAGQTFTISAPDLTGKVSFTPANQVVLALGAKCEIAYTYSVLKMPTIDSNAGPGVQTTEIGFARGTHPGTGGTGTSTYFLTRTAFRDTPTITAQASPSVPLGGTIFATATLSAGTAPTGSIVFDLFSPSDPNCLGTPSFTTTNPVNGNGSYQSAGFVAGSPGTWRWTARYNGDANNSATPRTPCAAPSAAVVVSGRVSGDYTGDGHADIAVYRPSNGGWFIFGGTSQSWGIAGDIPVPGDYNGNGITDLAIYRPSNGGWFVNGGTSQSWGIAGDIPVPGDYDGDGDTDFAVYRPSNGGWFVNGGTSQSWGIAGDVPVPGDYDGDGDTDVAVYRPSTGGWFVKGGASQSWGIPNDVPVPADYNGDGHYELAIYRPSNGGWFVFGGATQSFGIAGDVPLPLPYAVRSVYFP